MSILKLFDNLVQHIDMQHTSNNYPADCIDRLLIRIPYFIRIILAIIFIIIASITFFPLASHILSYSNFHFLLPHHSFSNISGILATIKHLLHLFLTFIPIFFILKIVISFLHPLLSKYVFKNDNNHKVT